MPFRGNFGLIFAEIGRFRDFVAHRISIPLDPAIRANFVSCVNSQNCARTSGGHALMKFARTDHRTSATRGGQGPSPIRNSLLIFYFLIFFSHFYFPASGQAVVAGVVPSSPWFLPSIFIAHSVQQSHCSSIFHRVLLTHALALSASQFLHKKKSQRIFTRMHSAGLELTKLTYTRLEDNMIRYWRDRHIYKFADPGTKTIAPRVGTARTV